MFTDATQRWERWAATPRAKRQLTIWAENDEAFFGWTIDSLRSPRSGVTTDAMQAGLVRLAQGGDEAAAATLISQLRPGLSSIARWAASFDRRFTVVDEAASEVLSVFGEAVMRHRLDRRPTKIAANLLLDTRQRVWRAGGRQARIDSAAVTAARSAATGHRTNLEDVASQLELVASITTALNQLGGSSSSRRLTAELAFRAWFLEEPCAMIAQELGLGPSVVRTRLCRLRSDVRQARAQTESQPQFEGPMSFKDGSAPPSSPVGPSLVSLH